MIYEEVVNKLKEYNQEHLLSFYDTLNDDEKASLLEQISKIDFEYILNLYKNKDNFEMMDKEVTNIGALDKSKIEKDTFNNIGVDAIKKGKLAVCSMAGGQGTRLGFNGPKGTFMLELNKPTSIFETIINKLKDAKEKYGVLLYWYIMTSEQNHEDTVNFFVENNFFEYDKEHVIFFKQGELPLVDKEGKIVLKDKCNVFMAPDGNGGIFRALGDKKILDHMKEHDIQYLSVGNVDNILIDLVEPLALGVMINKNAELVSKSFMKPSPEGKWGVFCKMNGKFSVIEYIETPKELLEARNEEGELIFGDAHYGCNLFDRKLLERIVSESLTMHAACKKNKAINSDGESEEIDTYKFEAFIFDAFGMANDPVILRGNKDEEFAPIKNKEGDESPATAIALYKKFYNM